MQFIKISLFLVAAIQPLFGTVIEPNRYESPNTYFLQDKLHRVPLHDKICMRHFFDLAINKDQAAHVLCFDNKPISLTAVVLKTRRKKFNDVLNLKGWLAFKKHKHLFCNENIVFNEKVTSFEGYKFLHIFIINKRALIKTLDENILLFRSELDQDFDPFTFIKQIDSGISLYSLLNHNEMLLGILLGFGEEASHAYKIQHDNAGSSIPEWSDHYCGVVAKQPQGCKIYPVVFMGDPNSAETKQLISNYEDELQLIWLDYQKKKDSLTFFLEHLCKEEKFSPKNRDNTTQAPQQEAFAAPNRAA